MAYVCSKYLNLQTFRIFVSRLLKEKNNEYISVTMPQIYAKSMAQRKKDVILLLTHWSYVSLALSHWYNICLKHIVPDSNVHGINTGPTWVLSAPDEPHGGPMNLAIRGSVIAQRDSHLSRCLSWADQSSKRSRQYAAQIRRQRT